MVGAVFGEIQLPLFVANATFGEAAHKLHIQFSWQGQNLVKFNCRLFSWQAQYLMKFEMVAGAQNACCTFENMTRVATSKSKLICAAGCGPTGSCSDLGRCMLGSWLDRPLLQMTFQPFSEKFSDILERHFSRQAQYLLLEDDSCYSSHCTGRFMLGG